MAWGKAGSQTLTSAGDTMTVQVGTQLTVEQKQPQHQEQTVQLYGKHWTQQERKHLQ